MRMQLWGFRKTIWGQSFRFYALCATGSITILDIQRTSEAKSVILNTVSATQTHCNTFWILLTFERIVPANVRDHPTAPSKMMICSQLRRAIILEFLMIPVSTSAILLSGILCQMLSRSSYPLFLKICSFQYWSIRPAFTPLITISSFHHRSQYLVWTHTSIASLLVSEFLFVIKTYTNGHPQHHRDDANNTKSTQPVANRTRKTRKEIVQSTWV